MQDDEVRMLFYRLWNENNFYKLLELERTNQRQFLSIALEMFTADDYPDVSKIKICALFTSIKEGTKSNLTKFLEALISQLEKSRNEELTQAILKTLSYYIHVLLTTSDPEFHNKLITAVFSVSSSDDFIMTDCASLLQQLANTSPHTLSPTYFCEIIDQKNEKSSVAVLYLYHEHVKGKDVSFALPKVIELSKLPEFKNDHNILLFFGVAGSEETVDYVIDAFTDESVFVRTSACDALIKMNERWVLPLDKIQSALETWVEKEFAKEKSEGVKAQKEASQAFFEIMEAVGRSKQKLSGRLSSGKIKSPGGKAGKTVRVLGRSYAR